MKTKHPVDPARLWRAQQVKDFVRQAKDRVGAMGWSYLSQDMREALVAQKALEVVSGMGRGEVPCAAVWCLRMDMFREAGLLDHNDCN